MVKACARKPLEPARFARKNLVLLRTSNDSAQKTGTRSSKSGAFHVPFNGFHQKRCLGSHATAPSRWLGSRLATACSRRDGESGTLFWHFFFPSFQVLRQGLTYSPSPPYRTRPQSVSNMSAFQGVVSAPSVAAGAAIVANRIPLVGQVVPTRSSMPQDCSRCRLGYQNIE